MNPTNLRILKRPDGYWLYVEAGGVEALIGLGDEMDHGPLTVRVLEAAAVAEILPAGPREHTLDATCWCGPMKLDDGKTLRHHNCHLTD